MSRRPISEADLTHEEQEHVRNALYFLRAKFDRWKTVAQMLGFEEQTLVHAAAGQRNISARLTLRLAKWLKINVEDLTSGRYPAQGACPRCGYHLPLDGKFKNASSSMHRPTSILGPPR